MKTMPRMTAVMVVWRARVRPLSLEATLHMGRGKVSRLWTNPLKWVAEEATWPGLVGEGQHVISQTGVPGIVPVRLWEEGIEDMYGEVGPPGVELPALHLQGQPQGLAGDAHQDGVDEASGDGHGLEGLEGHLAPGHQEGRGRETLGERPEQPLEPRGVRVAVAGQAVDHQAAGVRAGHEVKYQGTK